ncbi:ATP-dependent zinc metalloprotease FtsH [Pedobacter sp. ASV28]|uniref:ATP-dependent zinc metalloprotease FtsH n=1 Tax=Pedobacter sp. ASV28 TaxID=2795123 RepID=UPI0018ECF420|nr:ATP-dependent zinc metalloprotease FtsH [Pedobacter sp. ASV28]
MKQENNNSNKPNRSIKKVPNIPKRPQKTPKFNIFWVYAAIIIGLLAVQFLFNSENAQQVSYSTFEKEMLIPGDVQKIVSYKSDDIVKAEVYIKDSKKGDPKYKKYQSRNSFGTSKGPMVVFNAASPEQLDRLLKESQANIPAENQIKAEPVSKSNAWTGVFLNIILPLLLFAGLWIFMMRRMGGGGGGGGGQIFNIGKSKATLFDKESQVNITFNDVAGLEEAKTEVMEIVDFLKNPKKYTNLGGKIPKGALLVGSPGTGKTLLAKAVAGEAQVPFFSLSGSDFVEMFVGVGASRVRDLFKQAKDKAPCIIFIDEIDAIGRARGKGSVMGGNDERENTLNQLLVEMDGFGTDSGIIILAATNRPDVLDSALMRPGRFDRQISIDKPDLVGREQIFKVHLKPVKTSPDVDAKKLSAQTPGFAGAEIANVCNEAALIAARRNKESVDMQDFQDAIDRVIGGLEKKNKIISPEEKKIVAYHEAGHAIAGWFLEHANPLVKVSIVPRGVAALGYAQYLPKEQFLYTTEQLMDDMCMTMGGRVAEDIIFDKISTGALSDLEHITRIAYGMVKIYGMNKNVGNISFYDPHNEYNFDKPYSDKTAELIDNEVRNLSNEVYERTKTLLLEKREGLEKLAQKLLEKEILFQADLEELLGKRPFDTRTTYDEFVNGATVIAPKPEEVVINNTDQNNDQASSAVSDSKEEGQ